MVIIYEKIFSEFVKVRSNFLFNRNYAKFDQKIKNEKGEENVPKGL